MEYQFYVLKRFVPARRVQVQGFPFPVELAEEVLYLKASEPQNPWTTDVFEAFRFETRHECKQAMIKAIFHGPCRHSKYVPTLCTLTVVCK